MAELDAFLVGPERQLAGDFIMAPM